MLIQFYNKENVLLSPLLNKQLKLKLYELLLKVMLLPLVQTVEKDCANNVQIDLTFLSVNHVA